MEFIVFFPSPRPQIAWYSVFDLNFRYLLIIVFNISYKKSAFLSSASILYAVWTFGLMYSVFSAFDLMLWYLFESRTFDDHYEMGRKTLYFHQYFSSLATPKGIPIIFDRIGIYGQYNKVNILSNRKYINVFFNFTF